MRFGGRLLESIAYWLATGFGTGFSPIAPGTVGCVVGLPLAWILYRFLPLPAIQALVLSGLSLVGVYSCQLASQRLGQKDPPSVVWDEIVAIAWTLFA